MKKTNSKTKMNFFAKSIAAVLVLVLIVGVGFVGFGNHTKTNNWFSVDVNAATATDLVYKGNRGMTFDVNK